MKLACLVLLAAVAALTAGCGNDRRDEADAYLRRVNTLSIPVRGSVGELNHVYSDLRAGRTHRVAYLRADRQLADYRRRLVALEPPPAARRLHRDLVAYATAQSSFAHEVALFERYQSSVAPVSGELARATRRVRHDLATRHAPGPSARALRVYAAALATPERTLERLAAPPVLAPEHAAELARVRRLRTLSLGLVDALEKGDRTRVASLSGAFSHAGEVDVAAARAEAAAVRAYDGRLRRIYRLGARVQKERTDLEQSLQ